MEGVITVQASRDEVERLKAWKKEQVKEVTQKSGTEKVIDSAVDVAKCVVMFAGAVATVALMICPADGPFGEIACMAAQPALLKAVESCRGVLKGMFVDKNTEQITAAMADLSGNVKDISIKDTNLIKTKSVSAPEDKNTNYNMVM